MAADIIKNQTVGRTKDLADTCMPALLPDTLLFVRPAGTPQQKVRVRRFEHHKTISNRAVRRSMPVLTMLAAVVVLLAAAARVAEADITVIKTDSLFTVTGGFVQPSDVAVGKNGAIYVLDGVNNRVVRCSSTGSVLSSFGKTGENKGEFNFPLGIDTDEKGTVYIADSGNSRIQAFSSDGSFLFSLGVDSDGKGAKKPDPTDVAVNSTLQRLYAADNDNHRILIYDLAKKELLRSVGVMGMEAPEMRFPFHLDLDSRGNLYVVEVINTQVKVLDPAGDFVSNIGKWGVEAGEFYRPKGVAIDGDDRVYVSDGILGVIQVFDSRGTLLGVIGDSNGAMIKFKTPAGMCIDRQNRLLVVESLANQVRVLQLG